jgi:hypothetical protein
MFSGTPAATCSAQIAHRERGFRVRAACTVPLLVIKTTLAACTRAFVHVSPCVWTTVFPLATSLHMIAARSALLAGAESIG